MQFVDKFLSVSYNNKGGEKVASNCDECVNYFYDEECGCYVCLVNLDEDEMYRFLSGSTDSCPYYSLDDEYGLAGKQ